MSTKDKIALDVNLPLADGENISLKRKFLPRTPWMYFIYIVTFVMVVFHVYILAYSPVDPWVFSMGHFQFGVTLGFLYYAARAKSASHITFVDIAFILASLSSYVYLLWDFDDLVQRAGVLPEGYDMLFGLFAVISVIELTRRTAGLALTILIFVSIGYCFAGPYLPGILWHKGYSFERVVSFLFSQNGIFNIPLGVTARFVYVFVLFGAFLELSGAAGFFMNFSYAIAGKSRGGPAKVAIISSGLLGMVNGTSTGNVVTTGGSMTIPLMKRTGYDPYFAGAVEATASTGGQIMPPVMGAAVFLMAQMMNQDYATIMVAAIIPAILYYAALYFSVDLDAKRLGLKARCRCAVIFGAAIGCSTFLSFGQEFLGGVGRINGFGQCHLHWNISSSAYNRKDVRVGRIYERSAGRWYQCYSDYCYLRGSRYHNGVSNPNWSWIKDRNHSRRFGWGQPVALLRVNHGGDDPPWDGPSDNCGLRHPSFCYCACLG